MIRSIVTLMTLIALATPGCGGADAGHGGDLRADTAPAPAAAAAAAEGGGAATATAAWGRVLAAHHERGGVDYAGLAKDRGDLDRYLESLSAARPAGWSKDRQLAFWINAYNAVVLHHVLERYPGIRSVKDTAGFFDKLTFPVAGKARTLDQIEQAGLALGDPRIHFAVVCASTSCPDLRGEPFDAAKLDRQLDEQTRKFLADRSKGLRWDEKNNTVHLSSIFKWYAGDFTGGSTVVAFFARGGVLDWVIEYLPKELGGTLKKREPSVRYLDYDWSLNDR